MSTLKVDSIKNNGSAVNFTTNIQAGDGLVKRDYYEQASEPSGAPNAAVWYDTADEQLKLKVNDKWYNVTAAAPPTWVGSRGVFTGVNTTGNAASNVIEYITIASPGNAADFGDLTVATKTVGACSNITRGVFGGGSPTSGTTNRIEYVTIGTLGNSTDFGDLTVARQKVSGSGDGSRGLFGGGASNVIDYITIATTGNAIDFGDIASGGRANVMASSDSHGGLQSA